MDGTLLAVEIHDDCKACRHSGMLTAEAFSLPPDTSVEPKPVSYIVGVDMTNLKAPVRFIRMSDGTLYRLKHHLARDGNEAVEAAIRDGSVIRGVESGITYRFLGERPYTDPAVVKEGWEAYPPPWQDKDSNSP